MQKTVKEMLRAIQDKRGCNQTDLAALLGVNKSQISKWLDGAVPRIEMQRKIKQIHDKIVEGKK